MVLRRSEPFGGVALDRNWDIVMASPAYTEIVNACALPGQSPIVPMELTRPPRPNMLRLLCHPSGYRAHIANWHELARVVLRRVAWESARLPADPVRAALWQEIVAYDDVAALLDRIAGDASASPLVVPVELRDEGEIVSLLSAVATLGTAQDITLRELRIEMFIPANAAAERWGERRLARAQSSGPPVEEGSTRR